MELEALERELIAHCAPTLAGIKAGSLFRLPAEAGAGARVQAARLDRQLRPRGVRLLILCEDARGALLYAFRPARLKQELCESAAASFLASYGYCPGWELTQKLAHLSARIAQRRGFPHEIGLFLSYPLEDVAGFIANGGKNCRLCGCWKVYGDAAAAERRFARYRKCAQVYWRLFAQGRSAAQLTVVL